MPPAVVPLAAPKATGVTVDGYRLELHEEDHTATILEITEDAVGIDADGKLTIPSTIEVEGSTYTPTALGSGSVLRQNGKVKELVIPEQITRIELRTFTQAKALEILVLPSTITAVGDSGMLTVQGSRALKKIAIETPAVKNLENSFSSSCINLKEVVLTDGLEQIGNYAFQGLPIEQIILPSTVTEIGESAFTDCVSLQSVTSVSGSQLTTIKVAAFSGCTKLSVLPDLSTVTFIGDDAFLGCISLTGHLDLASVTQFDEYEKWGSGAFSGCTGITGVTLGTKLTELPPKIFSGCTSLETITVPEGVTVIGESAFANCTGLKKAELPNSLTTIPTGLFSGCTVLEEVTVGSNDGSQLASIAEKAFSKTPDTLKVTIHTAKNMVTGGEDLGDRVEFTVESIEAKDDTISTGGPSLQDAIDRAELVDTITIEKNLLLGGTVTIPSGKNITLQTSGPVDIITGPDTVKRMFYVEEGATLTLDGDLTLWGNGIQPQSGTGGLVDCEGTFVLKDGDLQMLSSGTAKTGAVAVSGGSASFSMEGGSIQKNTFSNQYSGAVLVTDGTQFQLSGGSINHNTAGYNSAAVYVEHSGNEDKNTVFEMTGGTISDNTGDFGGVFLGDPAPNGSEQGLAEMTMTGGTITNNTARQYGGGIMLAGPAELTMCENAEISGNTAVIGGGVAVYDMFLAQSTVTDHDSWKEHNPARFTMTGGTVSGNQAIGGSGGDRGCGGGIYVASDNVELKGGIIEGNTAGNQGGGVYVGSEPYCLTMYNALITKNTASLLGGGLWFCPTGDLRIEGDYGPAVFDNTIQPDADGKGAGADLVAVRNSDEKDHAVNLPDKILGGGAAWWYRNGGVYALVNDVQGQAAGKYQAPDFSEQNAFQYASITTDQGGNTGLAVSVTDADKLQAEFAASLKIFGNSAARGGGFGSNGAVRFVTSSPTTGGLIVTKTVIGGDLGTEFMFRVELSDKTVSGTYGEMTFEQGVAHFSLKHGEERIAVGLKPGIAYTVTELDSGDYIQSSTGSTGSIEAGAEKTAAFVNRKPDEPDRPDRPDDPDYPDIILTKVDEGGEIITRPASFIVYKKSGGETLYKTVSGRWTGDRDEAWTYYTRDGRLTIYDLKPGTYYIEEVKAPDGYQKAEEPLKIVVEDRDMKVEFTNRPSTPPEQPKPIPDTGRSTLGTEKCR